MCYPAYILAAIKVQMFRFTFIMSSATLVRSFLLIDTAATVVRPVH